MNFNIGELLKEIGIAFGVHSLLDGGKAKAGSAATPFIGSNISSFLIAAREEINISNDTRAKIFLFIRSMNDEALRDKILAAYDGIRDSPHENKWVTRFARVVWNAAQMAVSDSDYNVIVAAESGKGEKSDVQSKIEELNAKRALAIENALREIAHFSPEEMKTMEEFNDNNIFSQKLKPVGKQIENVTAAIKRRNESHSTTVGYLD
jgi:hypothetical protein